MRIPDSILKSVVFIGSPHTLKDGRRIDVLEGTAFFVSIKSENDPDGRYAYVVTAAHIAQDLEGDREAFLRINTKEGKAVKVLLGENARWFYHPTDPYADVAVFPTGLSQEKFDYLLEPTSIFVTNEIMREEGIGIGDEVSIVGLFAEVRGEKMNLPMVRVGNIAMLPPEDERVYVDPNNWRPKRAPADMPPTMEAYLIEARSIGGFSGSPVFSVRNYFMLDRKRQEDNPNKAIVDQARVIGRMHLLGLIHGHWDLAVETKDYFLRDIYPNDSINMGVAIVTPAKKILETLNHPELVARRRKGDEKMRSKNE